MEVNNDHQGIYDISLLQFQDINLQGKITCV